MGDVDVTVRKATYRVCEDGRVVRTVSGVAFRELRNGDHANALREVARLQEENAALRERDANALLEQVHERIQSGVSLRSDKETGKVVAEWTRVYPDGEESDTRSLTTGGGILVALKSILHHEDGADVLDEMGFAAP